MSWNKKYGVYVVGEKIILPDTEVPDIPMTFHEARQLRDKYNSMPINMFKARIRPIDTASNLMLPSTQYQVLMLRMYLMSYPNAKASDYKHKMRGAK